MYMKLLLICCFLTMSICCGAQIDMYQTYRSKAVEYIHLGNFSNALFQLKLASPFASDKEQLELAGIEESIQDSIADVYARAHMYSDKHKYQLAIIEYQKLIGMDQKPLKSPLYAYIGQCYEKMKNNDLAKRNYELGALYGESYSALLLARYIRRNNIPVSTEDMISLYLKADNYYSAMDSLGVEYTRIGNINEAYSWFQKSNENYSKYKMASLLLDPETYDKLDNRYKNDDPITLLTEASASGYTPAQYYLGLLYYFAEPGDRVQKDCVKGYALLEKASRNGHKKARRILWQINQNL